MRQAKKRIVRAKLMVASHQAVESKLLWRRMLEEERRYRQKLQEIESHSDEEADILNCEEDDEDDEDNEDESDVYNKKLDEERKVWELGGNRFDAQKVEGYKEKNATLMGMPDHENAKEIDFVFHLMPMEFFSETLLPLLSARAKVLELHCSDVGMDEFIYFMGLMLCMTVVHLPERRLYWNQENVGLYKAHNFGAIMGRHRLESILKYLVSSMEPSKEG